jgi:hypothetical protein
MILAEEMFNARRGDAYTSKERDYLVTGTGTDADLSEHAAITAAVGASPTSLPSTDGNLARANAFIARHISNDRMLVTVTYGATGFAGVAVTPPGTAEYEFSYQAPSERIKQSLSTVGIWGPTGTIYTAGPPPAGKDEFKGAIGVVRRADGSFDIEGMDTAAGNTTNTWSYTIAGSISNTYESAVELLMGGVNDAVFKTREIGSMRLVSCTSQKIPGDKTLIRFGAQFTRGRNNIQIGNITVPRCDGHDYLWVYHNEEDVPALMEILPAPRAVIVSRVFPRVNLNNLGF